jgi:predicted GIY-YIG superfamily endonuclease
MDYGNIYKIISYSTDKIYIGSTVKKIEERLEEHEESHLDMIKNNPKFEVSIIE